MIVVVILTMGLMVAVPAGIIVAIVKLIKIPKPPAGLGRSELHWWYFQGGWKVAQREEELCRLREEEEISLRRRKEEEDEALQKEIRNDLKLGQRMDAIKRYQEYYGCSFSEAKYAIYEIDYQSGYERLPAFDAVRTEKTPIAKPFDYEADEYDCGGCDEASANHSEEQERLIAAKEKWQNGGKELLQQWREENRYKREEGDTWGKKDVISSIDGMDGHAFEHFCAEVLRKNGFSNVSVTPGSGDQGVDILAEKSGIKYAIQCKNYSSALGNTPVQEVNAGKQFYHCHVGVVLTNSTFTPGAKKLADATGTLLWDRTELQKMMGTTGTELPSVTRLAYKEFDEIVDGNQVLTEIDELMDSAIDATDPIVEASNRFSDALETSLSRPIPMDKELLSLGETVKKIIPVIDVYSEQIRTKSLTLFGSLAKQGYNGWPTEQSFSDAIIELHKFQTGTSKLLLAIKDTVSSLENLCGIERDSFWAAKQQTLCNLEQTIAVMDKFNSCIVNIFEEYQKFKEED